MVVCMTSECSFGVLSPGWVTVHMRTCCPGVDQGLGLVGGAAGQHYSHHEYEPLSAVLG